MGKVSSHTSAADRDLLLSSVVISPWCIFLFPRSRNVIRRLGPNSSLCGQRQSSLRTCLEDRSKGGRVEDLYLPHLPEHIDKPSILQPLSVSVVAVGRMSLTDHRGSDRLWGKDLHSISRPSHPSLPYSPSSLSAAIPSA